MNVLVSACLLGMNCRYDGDNNWEPALARIGERCHLVPVCPEVFGDLPTPREPSEIRQGKVYGRDGREVTVYFARGARETLKLARLFGCRTAILKERSPSCGSGQIYDGTFSGTRTQGDGITASLLKEHGIRVIGESKLESFLKELWEERT